MTDTVDDAQFATEAILEYLDELAEDIARLEDLVKAFPTAPASVHQQLETRKLTHQHYLNQLGYML